MAERTNPRKEQSAPPEVPYVAKVSLPVRRPAIIRRDRLIDALLEGRRRRVTIISAPAGYGKTTLLLDFAHSLGEPVCWYGLDERDRDLLTFLRYYVASGQQQFPEFGSELERALSAGPELSAEAAVDLMVAAAQSPGRPFVMILDDFHFLDSAPAELRKAIEGWLYRLPPECHVILAGRTKPALAILPQMSVRQELATMSLEDFSFACEEVAQLHRELAGKEITLDEAQQLADMTEGWAAALVLLMEKSGSARRKAYLEQLRSTDTLYQYILLEQFAPLPEELKEFVTGSAVPRMMDEGFLSELLGIKDAEQKLSTLEQANLFLVRDADDERPYRYHRLFRSFLVSHLRAEDAERFRALNLRAAKLREKEQAWEEAVYHYVQAGEWDSIVSVTDRVGWRLFEEGRWDTLADWLESVPAEELEAQPRLILWKARILHYLNQLDSALSLLSRAIVSFEAEEEWTYLAQAFITKGMCLRVKGDYQASKESLNHARTILMEHDGAMSLLTEARKELGITLSLCGELAASAQELAGALETYESMGDVYNIAHTSDQLGATFGASGRLSEGAAHLERARLRWMKLGNDHRLVQTVINLGSVYHARGDYEQAEEVLQEGLGLAEAIGSQQRAVYLMAALGAVKGDKGQAEEALRLYEAALEQAWEVDDAYIRIWTQDGIALTHALAGDLASAQSGGERALADAEQHGGGLEIGLCLSTLGLVNLLGGELKEAIGQLQESAERLKEAHANRELAVTYFRLADCNYALKRKRIALEFLEMAAGLAKELGYDHFLHREAARKPLLVQYAAANKIANGYYTQVLKMIKTGGPERDAQGGEEATSSAQAGLAAYGFGNLRVEMNGREITDLEWRSEKGKEMFFFFLTQNRPLRKEEIITALWPDLPEEKTTSAFHSNMYRMRKALYQEVVAKESGRYILDPNGSFSFDVRDFQGAREKADAADGPDEKITELERALEIYQGAFAPDFYTEWAENMRWQLEEQYMSVLTSLASAYTEAGQFKKGADICQRILEIDEFNEAAWYRLMSIYVRWGKMEAAKYSYNRYIQVISEDGLEEDIPDFEEVCEEVMADETAVR